MYLRAIGTALSIFAYFAIDKHVHHGSISLRAVTVTVHNMMLMLGCLSSLLAALGNITLSCYDVNVTIFVHVNWRRKQVF